MRPEKTFKEILQEKLETRSGKGFEASSQSENTASEAHQAPFVDSWATFFNIASKSRVFPSGKDPFKTEKSKFAKIPPMVTPILARELRLSLSDLSSDASYIYRSWRELGAPHFAQDSISEKELKKAFRSLAKRLHPDRGGDTRSFMRLKLEYDFFMEQFEKLPIASQAEKAA